MSLKHRLKQSLGQTEPVQLGGNFEIQSILGKCGEPLLNSEILFQEYLGETNDTEIDQMYTTFRVVLTGDIDTVSSKRVRLEGILKINKKNQGNLRIKFENGISQDFCVLNEDTNFQWILLGTQDRKNAWILSKQTIMDKMIKDNLLNELQLKKYDIDQLVEVQVNQMNEQEEEEQVVKIPLNTQIPGPTVNIHKTTADSFEVLKELKEVIEVAGGSNEPPAKQVLIQDKVYHLQHFYEETSPKKIIKVKHQHPLEQTVIRKVHEIEYDIERPSLVYEHQHIHEKKPEIFIEHQHFKEERPIVIEEHRHIHQIQPEIIHQHKHIHEIKPEIIHSHQHVTNIKPEIIHQHFHDYQIQPEIKEYHSHIKEVLPAETEKHEYFQNVHPPIELQEHYGLKQNLQVHSEGIGEEFIQKDSLENYEGIQQSRETDFIQKEIYQKQTIKKGNDQQTITKTRKVQLKKL